MPNIRSSADLRNKCNEISSYFHDYHEPVFITKNAKGDLAVINPEAYEQMIDHFELYHLLQKGMEDIAQGHTRPFEEAMASIKERRAK